MDMVVGDAHVRATKRAEKWERNKPVRVKKGIEVRVLYCLDVPIYLSIYLSDLCSPVSFLVVVFPP